MIGVYPRVISKYIVLIKSAAKSKAVKSFVRCFNVLVANYLKIMLKRLTRQIRGHSEHITSLRNLINYAGWEQGIMIE